MTSPATTDGDRDQVLPGVAEQHRDDAATSMPPPPPQRPDTPPQFILYQSGDEFIDSLERLEFWVRHLLIPVYGREVTSTAPWCPEWWRHPEAVAHLHGLFLVWESLTGVGSDPTGPAVWHRDFLGPAMTALRDASGPFAGCRVGAHRDKQTPTIADREGVGATGSF
ncbi:DUF4913 domain-containing protein [Micromonosporaceae bacterium B7E4]